MSARTTNGKILDVAIIGTGFAGLCMAIRLKQSGCDSFVVLEAAGSVGGTWRDNTYPGAACDVQSHLYSFSFELNPHWSSMFARQEEILAYLELCTDKYGIEPYIRFHSAVEGASFDETEGVWTLTVCGGREVRARSLVSGTGGLSNPNYPGIEGLDRFEGDMFHSARWDHDVDLTGKRVAVVGTGASAIQVVPQLAKIASSLQLFQRSAAWVLPKPDRPIPDAEQRLFERFPLAQVAQRLRLYWRLELRAFAFVSYPKLMEHIQRLAEKHIERSVRDPELRRKLIPDYTIGCKRILMANDYYPALQRDNVEVVTDGIERITAGGVVTAGGVEHEVDAIVLCTGFQAADDVVRFPVLGLGGRDLGEAWREGAEAYLGTTVAGFPNAYFLAGPNTGLGHNSMVFMIESQVNYVMSCLRAMRRKKLRYLETRADVQSKFNQTLQSRMARTVWSSGCSSWYQDKNGKNTTLWPGFTAEFRARTARVRLRNYHCVPQSEPVTKTRPEPLRPAAGAA